MNDDSMSTFMAMAVRDVTGLPSSILEQLVASRALVREEADVIAVVLFVLERRRRLRAWASTPTLSKDVVDG